MANKVENGIFEENGKQGRKWRCTN